MGRYNYTLALKKLSNWAYEEGYEKISFNHTNISYINWEKESLNYPKEIKIEGKYSIEFKVYLMLHELGHHQLRKDWERFKVELPISYEAENSKFFDGSNKLMRRRMDIVSSLEEEFKAWEEGFLLATEFDIKINLEKWNLFKSKCLMSYIRYYAKKKP
jgi:hypothetical protein